MIAAAHDRPGAWTRELLAGGGAALASLILHLGALLIVGSYLFFQALQRQQALPAEAEVNEVVISFEELIPEIIEMTPAEAPAGRPFVDVFPDQATAEAPPNATFESELNSVAKTEVLAPDPDAPPVPSQDGEDLPGVALEERRFVDAPDGVPVNPASAAAPAGARPAPMELPQPPQPEITNPQLMAEALPVKSAPHPTDVFDVKRQNFLEDPAESEMEEAKPTKKELGEEGGAPEPLEVAKVDMAKVRESFADPLEVIEENAPAKPEIEDAMPEKNPDAPESATQPLDQAPAPPPNAPVVPTLLMKPRETAPAPAPPGAQPSVDMSGQADAIAFNPERYKNKLKGSLSNVGRNAVDAESTPLGIYKAAVSRAIEKRWHQLRLQNMQFVSFGSLKVEFEVQTNGQVKKIRILHDDSNAVMTDFSLQAIDTADIPPMPPEIRSLLGDDGLSVTYDIIIF